MSTIFIPLNAFSNELGLQEDIDFYISIITKSNADGIEIRRELLDLLSIHNEMKKIITSLASYNLKSIYSAPIPLWREDGSLNERSLTTLFEECKLLQATSLKLPLGHFHHENSNLDAFHSLLQKYSTIKLLIENDQTKEGGQIKNLLAFFKETDKKKIPVKMTYDIGNWIYLKEDALHAAALLSPYVAYYHLKHVIQSNNSLITVPISKEDQALWKTVDQHYFSNIPKALEFPLNPIASEINSYIDLVKENEVEREKPLCKP
ncbi:sugar phosphate isomerase/epimerase family protein [Niallia nealsonii]|uniref:Xylose isomerase n=1 Tax=Niallia nealsonii TaxID=115979 RepID=A0A2N0YZ42_9BACI|nr:hypothetical protein [Niallia nealsonii]PKG22522.1 hypothetical protein CWS01_16500 [Niallia nealsonii]